MIAFLPASAIVAAGKLIGCGQSQSDKRHRICRVASPSGSEIGAIALVEGWGKLLFDVHDCVLHVYSTQGHDVELRCRFLDTLTKLLLCV